MTRLVTGEEFGKLFTSFTKYAFRYEAQADYREPFEAEPWRKFRDGEYDDLEWMRPWLDGVRAATAAGRKFQRVRVLPDPLTDYLRWEMHIAHINAEAGEEIRVLDEQDRVAHDLPDYDFWLFDDSLVALMRFDDNRAFQGAELTDDPEALDTCRKFQSTAWQFSRPFQDDPRFQQA
ncbi:DUF6879 family protein [Haloechinothrix halophila]|uniref:DUF6879 family protein n=1 Tax=Haloechinothrix halophila TaxID=1069073 RepID=UPI0004103206|nr:DUF6879 family protein [Haloechinothrix halophila]